MLHLVFTERQELADFEASKEAQEAAKSVFVALNMPVPDQIWLDCAYNPAGNTSQMEVSPDGSGYTNERPAHAKPQHMPAQPYGANHGQPNLSGK